MSLSDAASDEIAANGVLRSDSRASTRAPRVLIVDLNNFATFPTVAIGILVASLRQSGADVRVLCPLAFGVPAAEREHRERLPDHLARRIHLSTHPWFLPLRDAARRARRWWTDRPRPRVVQEVARALAERPDVVLLSAYLQHHRSVAEIGRLAEAARIPLLLGGPVFNHPAIAGAWRDLPGLAAIIGGEVDKSLPEIVRAVLDGEDLLRFPGVTMPDGRASAPPPPLRDLDQLPVPDFADFPWDRYRLRVVPILSGRGCQWSRCVFCSDVVSASMRTFRTRSVESVLGEMAEQSRRHDTRNFVFLDLKLNSDPATWHGIVDGIQSRVPGAEWIGTVHVDERERNGLSRGELDRAVAAGMRRVSFGLETGSQRLLDAMNKGSRVEACSEFVRNAHAAGLSVRCTMFKGFPGETADDLLSTARFLEDHLHWIDRVRFNEFSVTHGTPIARDLHESPSRWAELDIRGWNLVQAVASYRHEACGGRAYRRAKARVLRAVYAINRRPVRDRASAFDGLM